MMVVVFRNFCLYRRNIGLRCMDKQFNNLSLQKTCVRHLRGSRYGKSLDKEETKFRNLIKMLRENASKPEVYTSGEIPIGDRDIESPSNDNFSKSKSFDKDVTKFRNLLKTLTENLSKPEMFTSGETPIGDGDIDSPSNDRVENIEKFHRNFGKSLEEIITPLKNKYYAFQLEKKYSKSMSLLRSLGSKLSTLKVPITLGDGLPCPVDLTVPSPILESYRNQDQFSVGIGLDGNSKAVGFYTRTGNQNVVCLSPDDLIIIKESHKEFARDFQNYLKGSPLAANIKYNDGGYWHSLKIRSNLSDELMGVINMHPQDMTKEKLFEEAEKLREYFLVQKPYYLKSLYLQTSEQKGDGMDSKLDLLFGDSYILEDFNDMKLQISPESYFTSNTKAFENAYKSILKLCKINPSATVLDIFCGTGPLSLMMSHRVQRCIGIDPCASNIRDARENAILNNKQNVTFLEGKPEMIINEVLNNNFYEDVIAVVNPGRNELSKAAVQSLRTCKHLTKIIYITTKPKSCLENYAGLCRPCGARVLFGKYFLPIMGIPFDLSPHTEHFGLAVMFQRL